MKYTYHSFPSYKERDVSICDSHIFKIDCGKDYVRFNFTNGHFMINDCQRATRKDGYIEIGECNADEFSCVHFKREVSKNGALLNGTPISLFDLNQLLLETGTQLEVYLELYDFNYLYWRCAVTPNNTARLTDRVDIEVAGDFPVKYWAE